MRRSMHTHGLTRIMYTCTHIVSSFVSLSVMFSASHFGVDAQLVRPREDMHHQSSHFLTRQWQTFNYCLSPRQLHVSDCWLCNYYWIEYFSLLSSHCHFHSISFTLLSCLNRSLTGSSYIQLFFIYSPLDVSLLFNAFLLMYCSVFLSPLWNPISLHHWWGYQVVIWLMPSINAMCLNICGIYSDQV